MDENRTAPFWRRRRAPPTARRLGQILVLSLSALVQAGCSANYPAAHLSPAALSEPMAGRGPGQVFAMADGARLPYREWLPEGAAGGQPEIVVLALHGFNDSGDAWELPAPVMAAAGIAVVAPDQRGFGAAPDRGRWPGTEQMAADAADMAAEMRARFPAAQLYLMGESMGGAVLMYLAAERPDWVASSRVAGYALVAPAVWGRAQMNPLLRASLWITYGVAPGMTLSGGPVRVQASDNRDALVRMSRDPRTLTRTRVAAVKGLVDLMSDAQGAAPAMHAPAFFMYGGRDQLVPKHATAAAWRSVATDGSRARLAYYPNGYHLLLRDLSRQTPTDDLIAWLRHPQAPLPSPAEQAARVWLAEQSGGRRPFAGEQTGLVKASGTRSSAG